MSQAADLISSAQRTIRLEIETGRFIVRSKGIETEL